MASERRVYTDDDKALGYLHLSMTDGNIMRAARDSGISESTIRRWKTEWDRDGVPPEVHDLAMMDAGSFVADAERVRGKALRAIESKIPTAKVAELITTVGVLDDKIMRAKGLATQRSIVTHEMPSIEEMGKALVSAMAGALEQSKERARVLQDDIEVEPIRKELTTN